MDWSFLRATLARMGFGPSFISWVNLFYASPQSAVKFNGHMTPFFDLLRGVRQGVPLSPLSYVLYAEVLACAIRANPPISGLTLPGCSTPLQVISQYADDTSLVVTSDQSIVEVFRSYAVFERGSGSKLNLGESKGLWLGSWNGQTDAPLHLSWTFDKLKVLGGVIGPGNVEEDNWRPRIVAVENVLQSWKAQTLSYQGWALFVNALALSHIWYMASIFGVPAWVVRELNILVIGFFWKGNRELVARRVVVQASCFGGFSVASVQFKVWALLVQWIRRFVAGSPCWARFFEYHTSVCFGSSPLDVLSRPSMFDPGGFHLFTAISCWRGRLSMVVSQLSRHAWQLVCPQALLLPLCPISPPGLSILSYCRCIFVILTVSLILCVILVPFIGLLRGISYFGLSQTGR